MHGAFSICLVDRGVYANLRLRPYMDQSVMRSKSLMRYRTLKKLAWKRLPSGMSPQWHLVSAHGRRNVIEIVPNFERLYLIVE